MENISIRDEISVEIDLRADALERSNYGHNYRVERAKASESERAKRAISQSYFAIFRSLFSLARSGKGNFRIFNDRKCVFRKRVSRASSLNCTATRSALTADCSTVTKLDRLTIQAEWVTVNSRQPQSRLFTLIHSSANGYSLYSLESEW